MTSKSNSMRLLSLVSFLLQIAVFLYVLWTPRDRLLTGVVVAGFLLAVGLATIVFYNTRRPGAPFSLAKTILVAVISIAIGAAMVLLVSFSKNTDMANAVFLSGSFILVVFLYAVLRIF